jgi:hypothetical protein
MSSRIYKWFAIGVCLTLVSGCAVIRKATYPPDFVYLEQSQIKSSMLKLSADIWRIEDILATSETVLPYQREEIISILAGMDGTARDLGAGTAITNHPFIDQNIDSFQRDVRLALEDVKKEPPAYYRAGRLSGRCLACHRLRS